MRTRSRGAGLEWNSSMRACGPYGPRGFESLSRRHPNRPTERQERSEEENDMKTSRISSSYPPVCCSFNHPIASARSADSASLWRSKNTALYTRSATNKSRWIGSGYAPNQAYYVWVMGPNDNSTHYSGNEFHGTLNRSNPAWGRFTDFRKLDFRHLLGEYFKFVNR